MPLAFTISFVLLGIIALILLLTTIVLATEVRNLRKRTKKFQEKLITKNYSACR
jgi:hypothetical protein